MVRIEAIFVGAPKNITDEKGTWLSAIYRSRVQGPIELLDSGLADDRVADTKHHGRPGQAVCVHPIVHYDFWNQAYDLKGADRLGPGSVGENWTISGADEASIYCGDVYQTGTAIVQVSGPRMPCWKQERKLGLPGFLKRTTDSMRTGFYLRVLRPGTVNTGDLLELESRPDSAVSVDLVNRAAYRTPDAAIIAQIVRAQGLAEEWKGMVLARLNR
ncbi:MAG: MOSC domain-containing protein [Verrucomicrobia bacterium]|nr:MOSC domain-containing protein [Verrucomicrobiota bacterium]